MLCVSVCRAYFLFIYKPVLPANTSVQLPHKHIRQSVYKLLSCCLLVSLDLRKNHISFLFSFGYHTHHSLSTINNSWCVKKPAKFFNSFLSGYWNHFVSLLLVLGEHFIADIFSSNYQKYTYNFFKFELRKYIITVWVSFFQV